METESGYVVVDPLEMDKLGEFSQVLIRLLSEIDRNSQDAIAASSQDNEALRMGLDKHLAMIQNLESSLEKHRNTSSTLASEIKASTASAEENRADIRSCQSDLEELSKSTKQDIYNLEISIENSLSQRIGDAMKLFSPPATTDPSSPSLPEEEEPAEELPPIATADSSSEEVIASLVSRLQSLESRVSGQDAAMKTLQRMVADSKGINQEIYLGLTNKISKLEKQSDLAQRQATRLESSVFDLQTDSHQISRRVDELAASLSAVEAAAARRPSSAQQRPAGLTATETTELVTSLLASLPALSPRPRASSSFTDPAPRVVISAIPSKPVYAPTQPVNSAKSSAEEPKESLGSSEEAQRAAAAYKESVRALAPISPAVIHHHHGDSAERNGLLRAVNERLDDLRDSLVEVQSRVDEGDHERRKMRGQFDALLESLRDMSIVLAQHQETPVEHFLAARPLSPAESSGLAEIPEEASSRPHTAEEEVSPPLPSLEEVSPISATEGEMSSTSNTPSAEEGSQETEEASNETEEVPPRLSSSPPVVMVVEDDSVSPAVPTVSVPTLPVSVSGGSEQRGLETKVSALVDTLMGLSNSAQSIHEEQPLRVRVVQHKHESTFLATNKTDPAVHAPSSSPRMESSENSVAATEAEAAGEDESRRGSEVTAHMYLSAPPHGSLSDPMGDSDLVSEMGSVSYVDEGLSDKVHSMDMRLHTSEDNVRLMQKQLHAALDTMEALRAMANKEHLPQASASAPNPDPTAPPTTPPTAPSPALATISLSDVHRELLPLAQRVCSIEHRLTARTDEPDNKRSLASPIPPVDHADANISDSKVDVDGSDSKVDVDGSDSTSPPVDHADANIRVSKVDVDGSGTSTPADHADATISDSKEGNEGSQENEESVAVASVAEEENAAAATQVSLADLEEKLRMVERQLRELGEGGRAAEEQERVAASLQRRLEVEIGEAKQMVADNAAASAAMLAEAEERLASRDEVREKVDAVHMLVDHLHSAVSQCIGRDEVEGSLASLQRDTRALKANAVTKAILNDKLKLKANQADLEKLIAGVTTLIGDPMHVQSIAAAMHKCLVCDKPVSARDNSRDRSGGRPSTAGVGYDKADDSAMSATVPLSPIKKPSSARTVSGGSSSRAPPSRVLSPAQSSSSPAEFTSAPAKLSAVESMDTSSMMVVINSSPHSSAQGSSKKLNPLAAKNSALAQRLRSGAGGGMAGSFKLDTR